MLPDEKFSDDPEENLRMENEFLKLKLKAQFGEHFQMFGGDDLPPEVENQFLKNMIAYEEAYRNAEFITMYEYLGRPEFKPSAELDDAAVTAELKRVEELMAGKGIGLDTVDGPYTDRLLYEFITNELFEHEVEKDIPEGMNRQFIYEEFHPNHKADITRRAHDFILNWVRREAAPLEDMLSQVCVSANNQTISRPDLVKRIHNFFDAFFNFQNDGYNIYEVDFQEQPGDSGIFGHAEGRVKYEAVMENGEIIRYEGPYKLYMSRGEYGWDIFYFIMPGFTW